MMTFETRNVLIKMIDGSTVYHDIHKKKENGNEVDIKITIDTDDGEIKVYRLKTVIVYHMDKIIYYEHDIRAE